MSATTTATTPRVTTTSRVTMPKVLHSEWIKLRSLRSTVIVFAATVVVLIGMGLLVSKLAGDDIGKPADDGPPIGISDGMAAILGGVTFAQLVIGVLGVLVISGEYSTGMIRSSLAAVPSRLPVLWGKALLFAVVTFVLMAAAMVVTFFGGAAVLSTQGISVSLGDPGALRALIGATFYLTGAGVLGVALGFILRNTAAAITTLAGIFFLLPAVAGLVLTGDLGDSVTPYLPPNAGQAMFTVTPDPALLSPGAGLAVFTGYLAIGLGIAALTLKRRDA